MLLLLKTARAEGKPPTLFIGAHGMFARTLPVWFGDDKDYESIPQTEYTPLDLALCAGYQYYLDSLCNKCGTPLWYGRIHLLNFMLSTQRAIHVLSLRRIGRSRGIQDLVKAPTQ